jgi:hypothetical protein
VAVARNDLTAVELGECPSSLGIDEPVGVLQIVQVRSQLVV